MPDIQCIASIQDLTKPKLNMILFCISNLAFFSLKTLMSPLKINQATHISRLGNVGIWYMYMYNTLTGVIIYFRKNCLNVQ